MENVKKFYDALSNDKAMQERASALNKEGETPDEAAVRATVIAFAKAEGYDFTEADLEAYAHTARPLTDESLDAAAGGAFDPGTCLCVVGGGGKDPVTGNTCACVLGGAGKADDVGNMLLCVAGGFILPIR